MYRMYMAASLNPYRRVSALPPLVWPWWGIANFVGNRVTGTLLWQPLPSMIGTDGQFKIKANFTIIPTTLNS